MNSAENTAGGGSLRLPGFVDVHNHGAAGVDVNGASADDLLRVSGYLATQGVAAWMPTLVPDSDETYRRTIASIDEAMLRQHGRPVAQIVGVHYEGVFANEAMCGALRPQYFKPTSAGTAALPKLAKGAHMTTMAPELDGAIALIGELAGAGWIVSIGHTRAGVDTLEQAFEAGARHLTHFFNAMTGVHHRETGVAGWGLIREGLTFDIIADGVHVAPEMVRLAVRAKGVEAVSVISDSVAPTGLGDGDFELWGEKLSVINGKTRNERGSIAGSVCTMADCVRTLFSLGFDADEVAQMASYNPSRLLGLIDQDETGGDTASSVTLDQDLNVAAVSVRGISVEL